MTNSSTTRGAFLAAGVGTAVFATSTGAQAAAPLNLHDLEGVLHSSARHKTVIAATKVDRGISMRHAANVLNAFEDTYHEGTGALRVVCVFYGTSIAAALNDAMWGKYQLFDVLDQAADSLPTILHTPQNPFLRANPQAGRDDASIETLLHRGVVILICNNALTTFARALAQNQRADAGRVHDELVQNLVPGTVLVPAGVAAIVLAQEAGYTYLGA
jgi:intracellular sulfur oxidation DsrE/DsrF family protein